MSHQPHQKLDNLKHQSPLPASWIVALYEHLLQFDLEALDGP